MRPLVLATTILAFSTLALVATAQDPTPTPTPAPPATTPVPAGTPAATPAPTAPEGSGDQALLGVPYFPLEAGRRWTYRMSWSVETLGESGAQQPTKRAEHRLDVFAAQPQKLGGKLVSLLEWKLDGTLSQRSYFRVEEGYLRCFRRIHHQAENIRQWDFTPPQPILPLAPQVGQEWNWEGKNGDDPGKQTFKVVKTEKVETGAGTFEAIVVQTSYEGDEDKGTLTRWLVKGVGIVKEVSELRTAVAVIRTEGLLARFDKGR